jgi:hypothetical protein
MDGKTLVVKDLTTLLNSSEENRTEIYGQLRSIYDGFFEKGFGTLPKKVSINARIGLIAGVTEIVDKYSAMHSTLGERFLKIRSNPNKWKAAEKALLNEGKEMEMRQELRNATTTFLSNLRFDRTPALTRHQETEILKMSMYTALMRSNIWTRYDHGEIVDMDIISSEVPTRLAKQLKKLAKLLSIVRGHPDKITERELSTLSRVARDTAEPYKQSIMNHFHKHGHTLSFEPNDVGRAVKGLYRKTARNHFKILETLECVNSVRSGNETLYELSDEFVEYFEAVFRTNIQLPGASSQEKLKYQSFRERTQGESIDMNPKLVELLDKTYNYIRAGFTTAEEIQQQLGIQLKGVKMLLNCLETDGVVYQRPPGKYHMVGGSN